MTIFELFAYLPLIVLVPLVPAFILYKYLPPEKTLVSGPLQGLNVNLTGSFAAYVVTVLIVSGIGLKIIGDGREAERERLQHAAELERARADSATAEARARMYGVWRIEGQLKFKNLNAAQSQKMMRSVEITITPPKTERFPDGTFLLSDVPLKAITASTYPSLVIAGEGFESQTVHLYRGEGHRDLGNEPGESIDYDDSVNVIHIRSPITMKAVEEPYPFDEH